jgi:signal transduction histidine kinase
VTPRRPRAPRVRTLRSTVHLLVVVLVALLFVSGTATGLGRLSVAMTTHRLGDRVLAARQAAADLTVAYVDQETGQRGFLLTGDRAFLEPYDRGRADAQRQHARLVQLLGDDPEGLALLRDVDAAAAAWTTLAAQPQMVLRAGGPLPPDRVDELGARGKQLFDTLRARLTALTGRTAQLTTAQLDRIGTAQTIANGVTVGAFTLALLVAAASVPLLRRRLTGPLERLLTDVQTVAAGDHDRPIRPGGPREVAIIAASVDRMRDNLVGYSREREAAQHELTLRQEHDRMAADLHDLTIQRVFGLGLGLTSVARRHPELAPVVAPLVEETDRIIREVRTVIFDLGRAETGDTLRGRVIDVTEESVRALGFTPSLEFTGPVDTMAGEAAGDEVLAVLREALANVARHASASTATVRLAAQDGALRLTVTDNGVGLDGRALDDGGLDGPGRRDDGLANLRTRAERLDGRVSVGPGPDGGTVVDWQVPLGAS